LDEAERFSTIAICADDRKVAPFAIKAAIHRLRGNRQGEHLMAELVSAFLKERLFCLLVDISAVPLLRRRSGQLPIQYRAISRINHRL
jgi:hypothetical protein